MASFAKHLSTHLYFHMERANARKPSNSQSNTSSFHPDLPHRHRSWNKENNRGVELTSDRRGYGAGIETAYSSSRHPTSSEHRGSIMGRDWPEDYFSYSPYLLTPDLSAKSRTRRRTTRKHTGSRYELCNDQMCSDDEEEYSHVPMEHPKLRPPEATSPLMDRRLLPPTPNGSRGRRQETPTFYDIEEDCFIVPAHMRGRFLPVRNDKGVLSSQQGFESLEPTDPKVCIIIDFRENGAFASQDLPFPSTALRLTPKEWLVTQLNRHRKAFQWVRESQAAIEGLLLMNVERHSQFPFVTYLVTNTIHSDPRRLIMQLRSQTTVSQGSEQLQHTAGYEEVATLVRPSFDFFSKRPVTDKTGYIISAFRVFPGEDREKLERNWLTWTGARQMYKALPKHLGLRRLTFHKKMFPDGGITYVLMCECAALVEHVTEALVFVDHLRARCCGYTALYRPVDVF